MKEIIIEAKTFEEARKKLKDARQKNPDSLVGFTSYDDELNRKVLEKEKIDFLIIPLSERKDFMKQRNSGFNQVLAKEAKKKVVVIGINIDDIIKENKFEKAKIFARARQNVKLCNKNKIQMKFFGKNANTHDLKALGLVLGMPTWMTKEL